MPFDLDALVLAPCVTAFGEVAQGQPLPIYTPAGGSAFGLDGVFDDGNRAVDELAGPPINTSQPTFGFRAAALPAGVTAAQGDQVTIRGVTYAVRNVQPDSHGHIRLLLNLAAPAG